MKINKINPEDLPRWQKILLVLGELSNMTTTPSKFEDIVVTAFKKFPQTFHLKGYEKYPDSGDLIHKPLYDMRPRGLLTANQKSFSLTEKGLTAINQLKKMISGKVETHLKPSREIAKVIDKILSSEGLLLFRKNQKDKILDTDLFYYLGVTVHTSKNEFLNRLDSIFYAINASSKFYPEEVHKLLMEYHKFIKNKFKELIKNMSQKIERNI
ncbi:MAG: hypothetical protein UR68_C0024G0006 [Candidatus Roizmanbacteria bacterium GW2011_GWA2_35_19]|uniref:Uncharacterized protein n=1 Tax=Candidatus Roizmanbacteria bacterium GW2011_GWA2_35_19 TaxID=1618478 RepID=A0A0G0BRD8_9BACT|nr:MAG: hypothetical protein UR68_C0024G0006 [Candidatus Roizmanbacteria bacterium GW2011_GWA2_35_19]